MAITAFVVRVPSAEAVVADLRTTGPITAKCTSVVLLKNSTGRWKELHVFELPEATHRGT